MGYEGHRDLMTSLLYQRNGATLVSRTQSSDALGRPRTRSQQRQGEPTPRHDTYTYNDRSELTGATLNRDQYGYTYDNIGNRQTSTEEKGTIFLSKDYAANSLNQYSHTTSPNFMPQYDLDGNQTLILTSSGIWQVEYNADNRPVKFTRSSDNTIMTCAYDYAGRRFYKSISRGGATPVIEYYTYRNYLQIAALNGQTNDPELIHSLTWDPLYPEATRPLALHRNNTLYLYAEDMNKNVTELFTETGTLSESYDYDPYGKITATTGTNVNPIRFSSEYYDDELNLVYYNYRHYNPADGRWVSRDLIEEYDSFRLYGYVGNLPTLYFDVWGLASGENAKKCCCDSQTMNENSCCHEKKIKSQKECTIEIFAGHSGERMKNLLRNCKADRVGVVSCSQKQTAEHIKGPKRYENDDRREDEIPKGSEMVTAMEAEWQAALAEGWRMCSSNKDCCSLVTVTIKSPGGDSGKDMATFTEQQGLKSPNRRAYTRTINCRSNSTLNYGVNPKGQEKVGETRSCTKRGGVEK